MGELRRHDPGLYTEVDGETKCLYGQDAVTRCVAQCNFGTLSSDIDYKCTCVTKDASERGLKLQSSSKFWISLWIIFAGGVACVIGAFCLLSAISMCIGERSKNEYSHIEDGKPDSNPSAAPSSSAESTDATETTPTTDSGETARESRESMWVMPLRCSAVFLAGGLPLLFVGIYILMLDNGGGYFTGCGELAPQYYD